MRNILSIILLSLNFCLQAQEPFHIIYDVKDGLPSSEVYDLEMDDAHNIWFTTDRGVVKYDGYTFQTFTTEDGLVCNTNFEIFKDNAGNFWFSGYDGSLSIYDGETFSKSSISDTIQSISENRWLMQFFQHENGKYYFHFRVSNPRTLQGSHYEYDPTTGQFQEYIINTEKPFEIIRNKKGENFIFDNSLKEYSNAGLIIDDTLRLYGIDKAIHHNRRKMSTALKPMAEYNSTIHEIKGGRVVDFKETNASLRKIYYDESDQLILICTADNLLIFPYSASEPILNQNFQSILNNISISSVRTDPEGNTWATSINAGVIFIPSLKINSIKADLLEEKKIFSINPIGDYMLFNDDRGFVYCYKKDEDLITLLKNQENSHLRLMAKEDTLVFTNLVKIYEKNGMLTVDKTDQAQNNYSFFGLRLRNDDYLYGERSYSVYDKNNYLVYSTTECDVGLNKKLTAAFQDHKEQIWLGTLTGLYIIQEYHYSEPINLYEIIPGLRARISNFYPDGEKGLWISTMGSGIYYYEYSSNKFYNINSQNGIYSNLSHCLLQENDSTLWIGSNKGLERINYKFIDGDISIDNYYHLNSTDGLGSNYIYDIKKWGDEIWVAHEKGVDYFDPDHIKIPICAPSIKFDSITVSGQNIYRDSLTSLSYYQNDISFHFTGISFRKPVDNAFYRYALIRSKEDTVWNYTNNRNVPYTNLIPGAYTFIVSARNKYDNWSPYPAQYSFKISPFYRDTLWFRSLSFLILLLSLYALYKIREKSLLAKAEHKRKLHETEFKLKSAELEVLRNQMNPHFIYNTLNSIQNFIFKNEPEVANYFLASFSKLMRKSLEMSQLKYIRIDQEKEFLKNYVELEQLRFRDKFEYRFVIDENVDTHWHIPPLLIQPLVENAIKHGFKNIKYTGFIEIEILKVDEHLRIHVKDNGTGKRDDLLQEHQEQKKSFGLQIVRNRIQIINEKRGKNLCKMSFINNMHEGKPRGVIVTLDLPIVV